MASFLFYTAYRSTDKEEAIVPKAKKSTSRKPAVKVKDLRAKKNPTGGKKKKAQEQYLIVKMEDVLITS